MWNDIINIHPSELLSTKTKEFRINESCKKKKKKVLHNIKKKRIKTKTWTIYILYLIILVQNILKS